MELLTESEARQVINNFYTLLETNSAAYGNRSDVKYTGGAGETVDTIESFINSVGEQIVGSCLEEARKGINFNDPYFYYETNNAGIIDLQDSMNEQFESQLGELIQELQEMIKEAEEKEREREKEEETRKTKNELEAEYARARKQLQSLIRRREKAGVEMLGIKVPKIPKRITQGSINRLLRMSANVKSEYRYLSGRGYKGR